MTFDLNRFLAAQHGSYEQALAELRQGQKRSHWIWWVFPQLKGLGMSSTSENYGITNLAEARAYLAHPVLGAHLNEAVGTMLRHHPQEAASILGSLDATKFRSCLTLFLLAEPTNELLKRALDQFFAGEPDARTQQLLQGRE